MDFPKRWRASVDGDFQLKSVDTDPPRSERERDENERRLEDAVARLDKLQRVLHADGRYAVLLVFQAMDAAGKDGTIRAVMTGINPAGCRVTAFKRPSVEELAHDFLWRVGRALPERGQIGVFNRSHYEEVLVVKVHPEFLSAQKLPDHGRELWEERYASIRSFERHLARNGTIILKFWLHVSAEEQKRRLIERIDDPEAQWKHNAGDVAERQHWSAYMKAYESAISETSRPWAPWYVIPADNKAAMRAAVAETIVDTLRALDLSYPEVPDDERAALAVARATLTNE